MHLPSILRLHSRSSFVIIVTGLRRYLFNKFPRQPCINFPYIYDPYLLSQIQLEAIMQASSHHFIPLADQTNHGSSQPSQSPTIASTSHRPSRNHLWVSSYRSPTQPDAAARPLHFGGTSYHCTDDNVRSPPTSISSLNESCPLSQMSAYEVAHHNPLFQLDPNLPARQQQRNVPMDERFEYSIVSTPTSTTPEAQPSQQLETVASRYDWQPPLGPNGPKNTGRATKGKGKGKEYRGKRKQRGTTGGSQTQHTISQGNSMTFAHIHALDEFVVDNIIDYQSYVLLSIYRSPFTEN